jgi:hypothetical protein
MLASSVSAFTYNGAYKIEMTKKSTSVSFCIMIVYLLASLLLCYHQLL